MANSISDERPKLVFDGVCNLCGSSARFFYRRDKASRIELVASQTESGQTLLRRYPQVGADPTSLILIEKGVALTESRAVLRALSYLPWPWRALSLFSYLPRAPLDLVYRFIALNRYRWFGKSVDICELDPTKLRSR